MSNNWIPDEPPLLPLTTARADDVNRRYENVVAAMDRLPEPAASGKGFAPPQSPEDPANKQYVLDVLSSGKDAYEEANRAHSAADQAEQSALVAGNHAASAGQSAGQALTRATAAADSASAASSSASSASGSAAAALNQANRAEQEANRAEGYAESINPSQFAPASSMPPKTVNGSSTNSAGQDGHTHELKIPAATDTEFGGVKVRFQNGVLYIRTDASNA